MAYETLLYSIPPQSYLAANWLSNFAIFASKGAVLAFNASFSAFQFRCSILVLLMSDWLTGNLNGAYHLRPLRITVVIVVIATGAGIIRAWFSRS